MVKDPSDNVTECEEFFILSVEAYIVAAAMTVFGMTSTDEKPSVMFFPDESHSLDLLQRRNILLLALREVIDRFIDLSYGEENVESTVTKTVCMPMHVT